MAEHKACADLVAVTGSGVSGHSGECVSSPSSGVDDSGTESGEDFRLLSPEILAEVQNALTRLEAALPSLDPVRREALVRLVTRLQSCLKLQPPPSDPPPQPPPNPAPPQPPVKRYANRRNRHQRHTVGVSKEELADARRWLIETGQQPAKELPPEIPSVESQSSTNLIELQEQKPISQVFRPVKFTPNQTQTADYVLPSDVTTQLDSFGTNEDPGEDPVILNASLTYSYPQEVLKADSGSSLLEYDPSLTLFTPAQSVQIAVHKAAINKQISEEESKREHNKREESYDSEDGDVSSVEEDQSLITGQVGLDDAISSAQRLLQIATDNKKNTPGRFHDRSSKKQKMKRANTIDIPKPLNFNEMETSSPDEFGMNTEYVNKDVYLKNKGMTDNKLPQPPFQPKTESDLKFLAFLQQANKNEAAKAAAYNPSARGGQPWTNRFVNIKTAFEHTNPETKQTPQNKTAPPPVTQNWLTNSTKAPDPTVLRHAVQNRTPQPLQNKLPWSSNQEEEEVVVGTLTVKPSPGLVNKFSHAPKSAFKPIEKKPISQPQKFMEVQKPLVQSQSKQASKHHQVPKKNKLPEIKNMVLIPENQNSHLALNKLAPSVNGTVKQLATQKFSGENIPSKPIIKQYPAIQDKQFNAANTVKQHPFVEQICKPVEKMAPVSHVLPPQQFSNSIASAHKQFSNQPDPDSTKLIKIPQKIQAKAYKDGSECSPPKQYINSPPMVRQYSEPFDYPIDSKIANSYSVPNQQSKFEVQESLPEPDSVPYYSQVPAYVQHSTYAQPLINFPEQPVFPAQVSSQPKQSFNQYPSRSESIEEYPSNYSQQRFNNTINQDGEKYHSNNIQDHNTNRNHSASKGQPKTEQMQISYPQNGNVHSPQHRFTDESLVPNPLIVGQVYKPSPVPEYLPYDPPVVMPAYVLPTVPHYEPSALPHYDPPAVLPHYETPQVVSHCEPPPVIPTIKPTPPLITNNLYENNSSQGSLSSSKFSDSSSSIKQYLNIPYDYGQDVSPVISHTSKSPYFDESAFSSGAPSPHWNPDDADDGVSLSEGAEMQTAVARVMGHAQCQKAVTVSNRTQHRYDDDKTESQTLLRTLLKSPHSPTNMVNMGRRKSLEKAPAFVETSHSSMPSPDVASKKQLMQDSGSYQVTAKPPHNTLATQNERLHGLQSKSISSAASAFRPLVNNLSKSSDSDVHRPPVVPPSPPVIRKVTEPDGRTSQTSTKSSSSNSYSLSSSTKHYESDFSPKPHSSVSPLKVPSSNSPSFPNVLQKSESWHQLVKEQMAQGRHPPPKSPRLTKTKSSHMLAFPKQYEAHLTADTLSMKQSTVDQYLKSPTKQTVKSTRQSSKQKKTVAIVKLDDSLENVDEAFESLFQEVAKRK